MVAKAKVDLYGKCKYLSVKSFLWEWLGQWLRVKKTEEENSGKVRLGKMAESQEIFL